MVVQVLVKHHVPFISSQSPEGERFPALEMIFTQLQGMIKLLKQARLLCLKIPFISYYKRLSCWRITFIWFWPNHNIFN